MLLTYVFPFVLINTVRDVANYVILSGGSFWIFSLLADNANSQPITDRHSVDSLTQTRINICIHFVRKIG